MITTRECLRLGALVTAGALLACANDSTAPVTPPPVITDRAFTSLEIRAPMSPMAPIATLNSGRLEVRAKDQHGVPMIVGMGSFTISSDKPSVVTVGDEQFSTSVSNGIPDDSWYSAYVAAIAPGEAVISVSWTIGGVRKTAKSTIRVESTEGWSLKVDPAALTVQLGSTGWLQALVVDATGKTRIQGAGVFTSDRDDVVALYEEEWCSDWPCDGINVLGVTLGEATITAKFEGFSAKVSVTVVP